MKKYLTAFALFAAFILMNLPTAIASETLEAFKNPGFSAGTQGVASITTTIVIGLIIALIAGLVLYIKCSAGKTPTGTGGIQRCINDCLDQGFDLDTCQDHCLP